MSPARRSPARHTVHTRDPRYNVPQYNRGKFLVHNVGKGFDYWGGKSDYYKDGIKHGFDLSQFKSEKGMEAFLKRHGFRVVDQAPLNSDGDDTVRMNPSGVIMVTEHSGTQSHRPGFVGYVGFEASKRHPNALKKVVSDFKRSAYSKDESPGSRDFI